MKENHLLITAFLIIGTMSCYSQNANVIDIHQLAKNGGIDVYNRDITLIFEESYPGIRLSKKEGEGVAWIKGIEFSEGVLEFDVRGENIKQHSFVGIAFHGKDNTTFDAVYLRPFQFKETNEVLRSHGIQYISLPDFTWRNLRENFPQKYEHAITPSPEPNSWVSVRIVIKGTVIATYINGEKEPSLVVEKLTSLTIGSVGFYVADTSGGDFANLRITKIN